MLGPLLLVVWPMLAQTTAPGVPAPPAVSGNVGGPGGGSGSGGRLDSILGSGFATCVGSGNPAGGPMRVTAVPVFRAPWLYHVTLTDLGTGFEERFFLRVPSIAQGVRAPLVVAFHAFGRTEADTRDNTRYFGECFQRDWYIVAPLSATTKSFSSIPSQVNTLAALDYVLTTEPIDRDRVYGLGFSMGGGSVTNFAARQLDPNGPMFAAVVEHTGSVSLRHSYFNTDAKGRLVMEFWFGGSPDAFPFNYQRSSVVDLNPLTGALLPGDVHLATNLTHVPTLHHYVDSDMVVPFVLDEVNALHSFLLSSFAPSTLHTVPGTEHLWSTLDPDVALDFLAQYALDLPDGADTLADEDARYFHFDVEQDAPGAFTPFTWNVNIGVNRLRLFFTQNLARLTVHTLDAGLDPTQPLRLEIGFSLDGTGEDVTFLDFPAMPSDVQKNGVSDPGWAYDPITQSVTIFEPGGGLNTWTIVP